MIAVVGGYGIGLTMRVERAPEAGETVSNGTLTIGPGGKGSNQAIGIARLGHAVSLLTAVGDDAAAMDAKALWSVEGVCFGAVATVIEKPTMTGFITVDAAGENRISIAPGALAGLTVADVDGFRAVIREAELLVVSLEVPIEVARHCLRVAREEGTRTMLNPAPAIELEPSDWNLIDVITPNASEGSILFVGSSGLEPNQLAARLAEYGPSVVLTLGPRGCVVADTSGVIVLDPVHVASVVDTTGAGDAFAAALAVGLVEGMTLVEAAHFAAAAGAYAVTIAEVVPALPRRADVENLTRKELL